MVGVTPTAQIQNICTCNMASLNIDVIMRDWKTNAVFGKRIIMVVDQGGPKPKANRALADIIRQDKTNNGSGFQNIYSGSRRKAGAEGI